MEIRPNSLNLYTICNDCAFHVKKEQAIRCNHPDKEDVNCTLIRFCSSFQALQEIDSPCVCFGNDKYL